MQADTIWPLGYEEIELGLMQYWFEGYDFQVHETRGRFEPKLVLLNCASSVFWFHSTDNEGGDESLPAQCDSAPHADPTRHPRPGTSGHA